MLELMGVDVSEVFNPGIFTRLAGAVGLAPGFVADAAVVKPQVGNWNLVRPGDQQLYLKLIDHEQPWLLAGAPPCGPFSVLMILQWRNRDPEKDRQRLEWGRELLRTACRGYRKQYDAGRYFLHEAPANA